MKKLLLLAGISAAAMTSAHAGDKYIQVHAGLFQQTQDTIAFASDNFLGEVLDTEVESDADKGAAVGALIGGYVLPFVALEGEFTLRTANLDSITVDDVEEAIDDDLTTYAFMVNAVIKPRLPALPDPYVGVGVGYIQSNLEDFNGDTVSGQLGYQVKAGVTFGFPLIPGRFGGEVSYLATDDFEIDGQIAADQLDAEYAYGGVTGLVTYTIGF